MPSDIFITQKHYHLWIFLPSLELCTLWSTNIKFVHWTYHDPNLPYLTLTLTLSVGIRIRWLYPLPWGKASQQKAVLCMISNGICWWGSSSGVLGSVESPPFPLLIGPLWPGVVESLRDTSMSQIFLFENY